MVSTPAWHAVDLSSTPAPGMFYYVQKPGSLHWRLCGHVNIYPVALYSICFQPADDLGQGLDMDTPSAGSADYDA